MQPLKRKKEEKKRVTGKFHRPTQAWTRVQSSILTCVKYLNEITEPFLNSNTSISRLTHGFPELLHEHALLKHYVTCRPNYRKLSVSSVWVCVS